jgi:hypothetical protein
MKDFGSLHKRVQEFCDCYATTDPLREMSLVKSEKDVDEGALKWLALAILHGINNGAKKIAVNQGAGGEVSVTASYHAAELPSPGEGIGARVMEILKGITHIEGESGKVPLAVGVRDGSIQVTVKAEDGPDGKTVTIKFPK